MFQMVSLGSEISVLKDNSSQSNLLELNRNGPEGSHKEPGIFPTVRFDCFQEK